MSKNLFNGKTAKLLWFIKAVGSRRAFSRTLTLALAPLIVRMKKPGFFLFDGKQYRYFYHIYNTTWANERCVEIPILMESLRGANGRVLEVGNVLGHYIPVTWDVLDKYEKGPGVINEDITAFIPAEKYDLVFSISTFEHIGFDDGREVSSGDKIMLAFEGLRVNCLKKGGKVVMTIPMGYNCEMDAIIAGGAIPLVEERYLKRIQKDVWQEVSKSEALPCRFSTPFPYANCIMVGSYRDQTPRE
ncbi:MAG: hypothetical protein FJ276_36900 [Planctomycetes bacterium]|nr:hypothetical protein [Planctomycetota bacterium]